MGGIRLLYSACGTTRGSHMVKVVQYPYSSSHLTHFLLLFLIFIEFCSGQDKL